MSELDLPFPLKKVLLILNPPCRHLQGGEVNTVHSLLDEALAAATERCLEPVLLDQALLEKSFAAQLGS